MTAPKEEENLDAVLNRFHLLRREVQRRRWAAHPDIWAKERMGIHLWSVQDRIICSVRDNRKTAVLSCHEIGKSFIAATIVAWWIDVHPPGTAFAVTSAPTGAQVRAILWREIARAHTRGGLVGRMNQTEWFVPTAGGKEELVAFGRKPSDLDPTSFHGIHAKYVLVVFDEACAMIKGLWQASDSLIANDFSARLDIGNPDDPTSEFEKVCRPDSGWNVIGVSAFDTPNFTGEKIPEDLKPLLVGKSWVEEKRREWAPSWVWEGDVCVPRKGPIESVDPYWYSKVLGKFPPKGGPLSLIPPSWVEMAQERTLEPVGSSELGVDVGAGGDSSTVCHRRGPVYRIRLSDKEENTMKTYKNIKDLRAEVAEETGVIPLVKVDKIGIGAGICDRAEEENLEDFYGINVGEGASPTDEDILEYGSFEKAQIEVKKRFANFRAQAWWHMRTQFEKGEVDLDPEDKDLKDELLSLRYMRTARGQIIIEGKKAAKDRGVPSPNKADSAMLAGCPIPNYEPEVIKRAGLVW